MFDINNNTQFNNFARKVAELFYSESDRKFSPKKELVASVLAKATPNKPDGYNINTLKAELSQKEQESIRPCVPILEDHPEHTFNETLRENTLSYLDNEMKFQNLIDFISESIESDFTLDISNSIDGAGKINKWTYNFSLCDDCNKSKLFESMCGTTINDLADYWEGHLRKEKDESFTEYKIRVYGRVFSEILGDNLTEWLRELERDMDRNHNSPAQKLIQLHQEEKLNWDNHSEIRDILTAHIESCNIRLYVHFS